MKDIDKMSVDEAIEKTHAKMLEMDENDNVAIMSYSFKTIKKIGEMMYKINVRVSPMFEERCHRQPRPVRQFAGERKAKLHGEVPE